MKNKLKLQILFKVDNLCQFLPQDKVQEFSNLSPPDLLTETERSVGDPKLLGYHNQLKQMRVTQDDLEKQLESKTRLQQKEKQTYDALKDSVGHINEQKKIRTKLQTLKQKKAWIQYQNKREEFKKVHMRSNLMICKYTDYLHSRRQKKEEMRPKPKWTKLKKN